MSKTAETLAQINLLKTIGHESRTLLSGITGPVQIIRSLSDEPKLIEPLRLLELSVTRFDKFSFRALLLSDLLRNRQGINIKSLNVIDVFRYVSLEYTDLLDFYNLRIELQNDEAPIETVTDFDLLSHCIMIILEHTIKLSNDGSTISVDFNKGLDYVDCTLNCLDDGLLHNLLKSNLGTADYPSDIDLYLLKFGLEILNAKLNLSLSPSNQTIIKLQLPYTFHHE